MILIKVGWSLIAPKDKKWINFEYLKFIFSFLKDFNDIFLIHGTWNIGHGYVKNLLKNNPWENLSELLIRDFENWQKILNWFFSKIDNIFTDFKRIKAENFLEEDKSKFNKWKFIIWWDVLKNWNIISSDDIFPLMLEQDFIEKAIILTDVDGVYDKIWNIIPLITKKNFENINFWKKENDVTWAMEKKVNNILGNKKWVFICNWNDLDNVRKYLFSWTGKGTVVL